MTTARRAAGNPVKGMLLLTAILFGLIWFPLVGPFVAGIVGGLNSGSMQGAIVAWAVPTFAIGFLFILISTLSPVGINFGFLAVVIFHMGIVLVGALAGGAGAAQRE